MPLEKTIAMVNLDMVGRLRDKLYVSGVDSGTTLRSLVTDAARGPGVSLELRGDPFAPSDHTSFYTAGRPGLFFFTGAHEQYHRPDDTWQHINAAGMVKVMRTTPFESEVNCGKKKAVSFRFLRAATEAKSGAFGFSAPPSGKPPRSSRFCYSPSIAKGRFFALSMSRSPAAGAASGAGARARLALSATTPPAK